MFVCVPVGRAPRVDGHPGVQMSSGSGVPSVTWAQELDACETCGVSVAEIPLGSERRRARSWERERDGGDGDGDGGGQVCVRACARCE